MKENGVASVYPPEKMPVLKEAMLHGVTWRTLSELKYSNVFKDMKDFEECFTEEQFGILCGKL
jgi:hypothetical protein